MDIPRWKDARDIEMRDRSSIGIANVELPALSEKELVKLSDIVRIRLERLDYLVRRHWAEQY
ncbi:MAG: hypothetical protein VR74_17895 [Hyphomonas sp. BRH_c22]|nr:MAG: hypothetical protein VR74_17895 [Hyphomonas sp. BRH_c22]